jgi:hypothetical protein
MPFGSGLLSLPGRLLPSTRVAAHLGHRDLCQVLVAYGSLARSLVRQDVTFGISALQNPMALSLLQTCRNDCRCWKLLGCVLADTRGAWRPGLGSRVLAGGKTLASASDDRMVRLWNAATGAHRQTLETHQFISDLTFPEDVHHLKTD